MKKIILTLVLLFAVYGFVEAQNKTNVRQKAQKERIKKGVKQGDLTRGETAELVKQQRKIKRIEMRANRDGVVTPKEKLALERAQNKASRNIAKKRNN